jgi:hypothetical protein
MNMAMHKDTRTIHTIYIDLADDVLAGIEAHDEVEIVVQSTTGQAQAKKLNYRDRMVVLGDPDPIHRKRPVR